jgi:hypothetical protein
MLSEALIEVLTSQMGITGSCSNFEDTVIDSEKGNIEGTTTKIEDDNILLALSLVNSIGNGSSSRLVNDTENIKACNHTSVLGGLSLSIIEICWYGDNSMFDFAS